MEHFQRLSAPDAALSAEQVLRGSDFGARAPADRPYVIANMVSSVDGRAVVDGRSRALGNDADRDLFHALRTQVDAVMAGTSTLAAERYGRIIREPEARAAREAAGLRPDALAATVTRSGNVPWDAPLFAVAEQAVVVAGPQDMPESPEPVAAQLTLERFDEPSLGAMLAALRARHDVRSVLCEGGPTLLGALAVEGLLDELFLTLTARLAGGEERTVLRGPQLEGLVEVELVQVLAAGAHLFLRYRVVR